ncbi:hypothetical protein GCM10028798_10530 [Humibacter antri]
MPSLFFNAVIPFGVYELARPLVPSDTVALLLGAVVPVIVTTIGFVIKQRFDPIGVASIVMFMLLIGLLALTGGNPLVLEPHEAVFTGPIGLVVLASAAIRRPVAALVPPLRRSMSPRQLGVLTAIVGATLVAHFVTVLVLALALPVAVFLAVGRLVGVAVVVAGLLTMRWYRSRIKKDATTAPQVAS